MKSFCIFLSAMLLLSLEAKGANPALPPSVTSSEYPWSQWSRTHTPYYKYKVLRACGWTALGVGSAVTLFGSILCAYTGQGAESPGILLAIPVVGGALVTASVPTLVFAYKNRRKALAIGATQQILYTPMRQERQPALALCLSF